MFVEQNTVASEITLSIESSALLERVQRVCAMHSAPCQQLPAPESIEAIERWHAPAALIVSAVHDTQRSLQLAGAVRRRFGCPVLLVVSAIDVEIVNRAFEIGASFLCEPVREEQIERFVQSVLGHARGRDLAQRRAVDELARRFGFSPRQREIVALVLQGVRRRELADAIGISESTLKWHIRALLARCDASNLAEVARIAAAAGEG